MRTFLFILAFFPLLSITQKERDKLQLVWESQELPNEIRLNTINARAKNLYLFVNPDTAYYYSLIEYQFAKELQEENVEADALFTMAFAKSILGECQKSLSLFDKCIVLYEKTDNNTGLAHTYNSKGHVYTHQGEYCKAFIEYKKGMKYGGINNKAVAYNGIARIEQIKSNFKSARKFFESSIALSVKAKDTTLTNSTVMDFANLMISIGDFPTALKYYTYCLKQYQKTNNKYLISKVLNNIGYLYFIIEDYPKSLIFYKQSVKIKRQTGDQAGILNTYSNIAGVYYQLNDYSLSQKFNLSALSLAKKINDKQSIALITSDIANIYFQKDNHNTADSLYQISLQIITEIGDSVNKVGINNVLGKNYILIGNYEKAYPHCINAYNNAIKFGLINQIIEASNSLYEIYKHKNQYDKSLFMLETSMLYQDSIDGTKNNNEILKQEHQFKYEKQILDNEIKSEKEEGKRKLDRQRELYLLIASLALIILFTISVFRLRAIRLLNEKNRLLKEIEILKNKTILEANNDIDKKIDLNKEKIEKAIDIKLNNTDWKILNIIYHNPSISNKKLADEISLSIEGTSSSLRKMYRLFSLTTHSKNNKIALVMVATKLSVRPKETLNE